VELVYISFIFDLPSDMREALKTSLQIWERHSRPLSRYGRGTQDLSPDMREALKTSLQI
jgi:hypothetical protein